PGHPDRDRFRDPHDAGPHHHRERGLSRGAQARRPWEHVEDQREGEPRADEAGDDLTRAAARLPDVLFPSLEEGRTRRRRQIRAVEHRTHAYFPCVDGTRNDAAPLFLSGLISMSDQGCLTSRSPIQARKSSSALFGVSWKPVSPIFFRIARPCSVWSRLTTAMRSFATCALVTSGEAMKGMLGRSRLFAMTRPPFFSQVRATPET